MRAHEPRRVGLRWITTVGVVALVVAACSGGGAASTAPSAAPSVAASAAVPSEAASAAPSVSAEPLEIAYLSFAVANSYDAPMLAAAQAAAAAGNAKLTVFDANLDPAAQAKQLQDAVASGKYDGIITQPLFGAGLVAGVEEAIAAGIAVGNIDQILGEDQTTAAVADRRPQANVVFVPKTLGTQDRRARGPGLRGEAGGPVRGRLHLVGQGRRPRPDACKAAFDEATAGNEHHRRRRGRVVLHDPARPRGRPEHAGRPSRDRRHRRRRPGHHRRRVRGRPTPASRTRSPSSATAAAPIALQGIKSRRALRHRHADARDRGPPGHRAAHPGHPHRRGLEGMDPLDDLPEGGVVTQANVDTFLPLAEWPG